MSRIVLNVDQLAETSGLLADAAGEYQGIGARVASCDCGCMPADVAAVVDAATAEVNSRLADISAVLASEASDLGWRAGVDQDGGFTAVGAASGGAPAGGSTMAVGGFGFDASMATSSTTGAIFVGGNGFDASAGSAGVAGTMAVGGYGSDPSMESPGAVGTATVGGYGFDPSWASYGPVGSMTTGGSGFDASMESHGVVSTMTLGGPGFDPSWASHGRPVGATYVGGDGLDPSMVGYGPVGMLTIGTADVGAAAAAESEAAWANRLAMEEFWRTSSGTPYAATLIGAWASSMGWGMRGMWLNLRV